MSDIILVSKTWLKQQLDGLFYDMIIAGETPAVVAARGPATDLKSARANLEAGYDIKGNWIGIANQPAALSHLKDQRFELIQPEDFRAVLLMGGYVPYQTGLGALPYNGEFDGVDGEAWLIATYGIKGTASGVDPNEK